MRPRSTCMRMKWGMVISGMFLVFMLQGCTTPFISVEVKVGECASGEPPGPGGCAPQTAVAGGSYPGVTCTPGTQPCLNPGSTQGCRGGKKCTNVELGAGNCVCQCK
jgi:hypothetical protein